MTQRSNSLELREAVSIIRNASRIAIATHILPDPDAIGSLLGLGNALRWSGKQVVLLCDDPIPRGLHFLMGSSDILTSIPDNFVPELAIGVDGSDPERLGKVWQQFTTLSVPTLVIDHHITNQNFGTVNVVDSTWASTAEGLVRLLHALDIPIHKEVADCLLTGIIGDTRNFSTASTTPESLLTAAELMTAGADIASITEIVFARRSLDTLKLWGLGLSGLHLEDSVIWTLILFQERKALGVEEVSGSGLSNILISAEQANIAAVFTQQPDGTLDASFRARPGYDVATVALSLGGGGHSLAAGAQLAGSVEEIVPRVIAMFRQAAQPKPVKG